MAEKESGLGYPSEGAVLSETLNFFTDGGPSGEPHPAWLEFIGSANQDLSGFSPQLRSGGAGAPARVLLSPRMDVVKRANFLERFGRSPTLSEFEIDEADWDEIEGEGKDEGEGEAASRTTAEEEAALPYQSSVDDLEISEEEEAARPYQRAVDDLEISEDGGGGPELFAPGACPHMCMNLT